MYIALHYYPIPADSHLPTGRLMSARHLPMFAADEREAISHASRSATLDSFR
jgi:hypothetical protein